MQAAGKVGEGREVEGGGGGGGKACMVGDSQMYSVDRTSILSSGLPWNVGSVIISMSREERTSNEQHSKLTVSLFTQFWSCR